MLSYPRDFREAISFLSLTLFPNLDHLNFRHRSLLSKHAAPRGREKETLIPPPQPLRRLFDAAACVSISLPSSRRVSIASVIAIKGLFSLSRACERASWRLFTLCSRSTCQARARTRRGKWMRERASERAVLYPPKW